MIRTDYERNINVGCYFMLKPGPVCSSEYFVKWEMDEVVVPQVKIERTVLEQEQINHTYKYEAYEEKCEYLEFELLKN